MQDVEDEWLVEAGWHVRSPLRRRGYAAEAAEAVRVAAQESGIEHLIAIMRPDNVASQRVARKIGLALEREIHKNGGPALVFGSALHRSQANHRLAGPRSGAERRTARFLANWPVNDPTPKPIVHRPAARHFG
jgi:RimJ/RimL family protein N-acetyltransferase